MLATKLLAVSHQGFKFKASWPGGNSTTSLGTADTGQTFAQTNGPFGITSHQAYLATLSGDAYALATLSTNTQGNGSCPVKVGANGLTASCGLVVAATASTDALLFVFGMNGSGVASTAFFQLYKRIAGSYTALAGLASNAGLTLGTTYNINWTWNGTSVVVTGIPNPFTYNLTAGEQTAFTAATKLGLRCDGSAETGATRWGTFQLR